MPADTTTTILGLLLQGTGNNNNAWGTNLNNSVITPLENAVKGVNAISGLTGGAYTLTQANAAYGTIMLSGTLVSDLVITVPSTAHKWKFHNACGGAFAVLIKGSGGTQRNLPYAKWTDIICDGSTVYRSDSDKVGEYFFHAGTTAPNGAIECTGVAILRASFVDLFGVIGTTHGVGNGTTTFNVPDGYTAGKFLRSRTASVALGTVQTNQNKAHTHPGASFSANTGGVSADHTHAVSGNTGTESADHTHSSSQLALGPGGGNNAFIGSASFLAQTAITTGGRSAAHTHFFSVTSGGISADHFHAVSGTTGTVPADAGGTEARPENISGILCVRY